MIFPTIHSNGTHPDSLRECFMDAMTACREAINAFQQCAPNGRDYYPQAPGTFEAVVKQHKQQLAKLAEVKQYLTEQIRHIVEIAEQNNR